ncbi:hypothetical protein BJ170DRAFT_192466 [Xylariales sp. AK1849]|nr:hypothetical protein BJ170DRAFT_192466 [Xylariales sp. AK1849]
MENPTRRQLTGTDTNANNSAPQTERLSDRATLDAFLQFKELLTHDTTRSSNSIRPFEWLRRKPNKEHHPDWWTNSLDDTPEMYRTKQTRDVHLRKELVKYLRYRKRQDIVDNAIYTASNIESKISALDLRYLCCFDLCFTNRDGFQVQNVKLEQEAEESRVHNLPQMQSHRTRLFKRLNDSLVDLDIRHRILFARQCTPALVGSMIYLWHPQFLDGIDNYFGAVSRFTENSEGMSWTTSITLSHWKLSSIQLVDDDLALFKENRSSGDFPPNTIAKLGTTKKQLKGPGFLQNSHKLEERSSSLVITGDLTGNMWICSLLSSLTDSEALDTLINDSTCRTLQRFIHQQSTGRCLVFLMLLGHLCEKLAIEYEAVLTQLDVIVGLGEEVLLQGIDWGSSQALEKLKKMLWGLEALRAFGERLSASLAQIQRAKEAMERVGKKDAGYLHVDLLQEYQQVIEEFTKRYDILSDVDMRTKLKIKQVTGLRDGISTVTNVEDSQATLNNAKITVRQGNNIRTLTYITIAYLPLGFVTGLFSVQHAHFMDAATDAHFAGLTVLFVLVTYSIALFLQNIIDQMAHIVEKWRDGKPDHLPMRQPGEAERTGRRRTSWIRWLWVRLNPSNEDEKSSGST